MLKKKLKEKIKELSRLTSQILSGEKINYSHSSKSFTGGFVVGDIPVKPVKAIVSPLERTIRVYDKTFLPTAKRLAKEYEAITKRGIPKGYYLRGKWTLEIF